MRRLARRGACCERVPGRVTVGAGASCGAAMLSWIVWLIVAAVLGVAELLTTTLAFGIIAIAAVDSAAILSSYPGARRSLSPVVAAAGARLRLLPPLVLAPLTHPPC